MTPKTVLVPASLWDELLAPAQKIAPNVTLLPYAEQGEDAVAGLDDAEGILRWFGSHRYADLVAQGPRLRWLHTASAGVDHILSPQICDKPGLVLTDSGPAYAIGIPEFVLGWMLMTAHRMPEMLAQQRPSDGLVEFGGADGGVLEQSSKPLGQACHSGEQGEMGGNAWKLAVSSGKDPKGE